MPAEFLNRSKQELVERAKKALMYMNSDSVTGFNDLGTKLFRFCGFEYEFTLGYDCSR